MSTSGTLARALMYEAAAVILARVKRTLRLKDWAQVIAERSGPGLHSICRSLGQAGRDGASDTLR